MTRRVFIIAAVLLFAALTAAQAAVSVSSIFGNNMVLQRGRPVPVWGMAAASKTITVTYNGQTKTTTSDPSGNWQLFLDTMGVNTVGSSMTITEAAGNTLTFTNVVVGDVWLCSGQSNMAWTLSGCNRQVDIDSASFPNLRHFYAPMVTSSDPMRTITANWNVCTPSTAGGFSAVGFYFGRKIYQDQLANIPIGLITSSIGGTVIDIWLAPEGLSDIPVLQPLYNMDIMPWGPFSAFNGMVYPLAPYGAKGMIWYQGENRESSNQSTDSYYLKEKALQQGWKRAFGMDDFALYVVQLANYTSPSTGTTPEAWGSWSDTRQMQTMVAYLPHGGVASALDVGEAADIHPKDKFDVGERLALWALKNDYGRTTVVPTGPILRDVTISGSKLICSFDYVGAGLMVGSKTPYVPTAEVVGGTLQRFVIAGATGSWFAADAVINGNTVEVSSTSVTTPRKVAYAYWINPTGANLYNRDGLPANPFYVDDVTIKFTVTASAGAGGSISPLGITTYLKRFNPLYTITPDSGYSIQDVTVDGVSVGSVKAYTFDPLYTNHTISATFVSTAPSYTITATGNASGSLSPSGAVSVAQGGSQTFGLAPNAGCRLISLTIDGAPAGNRSSVLFTDVRTNHTISAFFAPIPTPGTGTGLKGDYYAGQNFDAFKVSRTDATVNFDWGNGSPDAAIPADGFSVRWTGQIEPQFTDTYKFILAHDEGARLWVNNQPVINSWGAAGTHNGSIALTAGVKVPITVEYYDYVSAANCKIEWICPSILKEVVPRTQLYAATTPVYTLTASAGAGGSFSPSGTVLANSGDNQVFTVVPNTGYYIMDVKVDNVSQGAITTYTFSNVTANHTISATFGTLPSYLVSGKITKQSDGTGISGATVGFYTAPSVIGIPAFSATTDSSGNYSISIPTGTWYARGSATGYFVSAARTVIVVNAPLTGIDIALLSSGRNVPRTPDLLFSAVTDTFPASGNTGNWASFMPSGQTLTAIGSPTVESIDTVKWEKNLYNDGDGYQQGSYTSPVAINGATIIVAARPIRAAISTGWTSIVDIFYSRLVLGMHNDTGLVNVAVNGNFTTAAAGTAVSDGQSVVLSLVVQPDGTYKVWTNGVQTISNTATSSMTSLDPKWNGGGTGFWSYMNVGRNQPDGWTTFNGYIGDVFVYKVALSDAERQQLETDIGNKFSINTAIYTITTSAGANGSISPSGAVSAPAGTNRTFTIAPNTGYGVANVLVDGVSVGAVTSYTFTNVAANHTISASFQALTPYTITASAGTGGTVTPSGAVTVYSTTSQTFAIAANSGFVISNVIVDGVSQGAMSSYTFSNLAANHTISATFTQTVFTITASSTSNGSISPSGAVSVNLGGSQTFTVTPNPGYSITNVTVDGVSQGQIGSYTFNNVTANHTISARFTSGTIPRSDDILFACSADDLPASGAITSWLTTYPTDGTLTPIGTPVVETISGKVWEQNVYTDGDGFQFGTAYTSSIPVNGASVVVVIKPIRNSTATSWVSVVDIFGDRLVFGVRGDSGRVCVKRNGSNELGTSANAIPSGQVTILTLVVQPDGTYKVWANGTQIMSIATNGAFTSLVPNVTNANFHYINVGRGSYYAWSTFNGNIGDVYVYKVALSDSERGQLESSVAGRYGIPWITTHTITASAGVGGTITPSGAVVVTDGSSQTFTITPSSGCAITGLTVDGTSIVPVVSYTFGGVAANHTIAAAFGKPLGVSNKAALTDAKLVGRAVKVWGKVKSVNGTTSFTIDDGYGSNITINDNGVALPAGFDSTKYAIVTGVLSVDGTIQAQAIITGS